MMIYFLTVACSIALRWTLLEHDNTEIFRSFLTLLLPNKFWSELERCPFCNGFWVSLATYWVLTFQTGIAERLVFCLPVCLLGAYSCLLVEVFTEEIVDRYLGDRAEVKESTEVK